MRIMESAYPASRPSDRTGGSSDLRVPARAGGLGPFTQGDEDMGDYAEDGP